MEDKKILVEELAGLDIARLSLESLGVFYKRAYGVEMGTCGSCRTDAVEALKKFVKAYTPILEVSTSYRFKKEYADKEVYMMVNGTRICITKDNLSESNIQRILDHPGYAPLLEPNPDFDKKKQVSNPVQPSTSTLTEAPAEESSLNPQPVNQELQPNGLKPLKEKSPKAGKSKAQK